MRAISRRVRRGFVLPYVLGFAALLAVIAMFLLESANSDESTIAFRIKCIQCGGGGLNVALGDLTFRC